VLACDNCKREIAPDESTYRVVHKIRKGFNYWLSGFVCFDCTKELFQFSRPLWKDPAPCIECGRGVVEDLRYKPLTIRVCSARCRSRYHNKRQWRMRKALRSRTTCPHCQTAFEPRRADSVYCSAACRQAAYRHRSAHKADYGAEW
jgi:hypothetical protein